MNRLFFEDNSLEADSIWEAVKLKNPQNAAQVKAFTTKECANRMARTTMAKGLAEDPEANEMIAKSARITKKILRDWYTKTIFRKSRHMENWKKEGWIEIDAEEDIEKEDKDEEPKEVKKPEEPKEPDKPEEPKPNPKNKPEKPEDEPDYEPQQPDYEPDETEDQFFDTPEARLFNFDFHDADEDFRGRTFSLGGLEFTFDT